MKINDYKVGDELFRYVDGAGIFRYVVIGRRERPDEVQLEVECKTCTHGWQCQLLLARDDRDRIVAVHMLNNDEEEDQRNWHGNEGYHFHADADAAQQEKLEKLINCAKERLASAKDALRVAQDRLKELQGLAEGVQA